MAENFPFLGRETDIQDQEVQRISNKMNPKSTTPSNIIIKLPTSKGRILKA